MFVSGGAAAAQPLEPGARFLVERVAQPRAASFLVPGRLEVAEEGLRRELLHLLPGRASDREVAGDEADALPIPMLRREALEQRVGVRRVADRERPHLRVGAD